MWWCWWLFFIPVFLSVGPVLQRAVRGGQSRMKGSNIAQLQSNVRPQIKPKKPLRSAPQLPPSSTSRSSIRAPPPPSEPAPRNQPTVRPGFRLTQNSKLSDFVIKYLTAWILVMRNFSGSWCVCILTYICIPAEYLVKSLPICPSSSRSGEWVFVKFDIVACVMKVIDMIQFQLIPDKNNILCMYSYMHVCANSEHYLSNIYWSENLFSTKLQEKNETNILFRTHIVSKLYSFFRYCSKWDWMSHKYNAVLTYLILCVLLDTCRKLPSVAVNNHQIKHSHN